MDEAIEEAYCWRRSGSGFRQRQSAAPRVTVTSLHPPRLCRLAVFSIKPTLLSFNTNQRLSPPRDSLYKPTILSLYKHHNHVLSRKGRPVLDLKHEDVSSEVYRWRRSEFIWHIRATPRLAFAQAVRPYLFLGPFCLCDFVALKSRSPRTHPPRW